MKLPRINLPGAIPKTSGNRKYQVSAGVKKRLSEMTDAEKDRVLAAESAVALMGMPDFAEHAKRNPEWAAKIQDNAANVKAIEGK